MFCSRLDCWFNANDRNINFRSELLNGIYGCGITGDYDGFYAFSNELLCNAVNPLNNEFDRFFTVRRMEAVGNIDDIFMGELLGNAFSNGQSTNARVKYANRS